MDQMREALFAYSDVAAGGRKGSSSRRPYCLAWAQKSWATTRPS